MHGDAARLLVRAGTADEINSAAERAHSIGEFGKTPLNGLRCRREARGRARRRNRRRHRLGSGCSLHRPVNPAAQKLAHRGESEREHEHPDRRHRHDRQLLREIRGSTTAPLRDDARVRRHRVRRVARGRLAILARDRIRADRAAPSPRARARAVDVLASPAPMLLPLQLVEAAVQGLDPGAGDPGIVLERAHELLGFLADLDVEIADLRVQFLDARMSGKQRRGLLGELRAQGHALLGEPADQFGIEDVGRSIGLPLFSSSRMNRALASRSAFCARAADELRVQLAQLSACRAWLLLVPT